MVQLNTVNKDSSESDSLKDEFSGYNISPKTNPAVLTVPSSSSSSPLPSSSTPKLDDNEEELLLTDMQQNIKNQEKPEDIAFVSDSKEQDILTELKDAATSSDAMEKEGIFGSREDIEIELEGQKFMSDVELMNQFREGQEILERVAEDTEEEVKESLVSSFGETGALERGVKGVATGFTYGLTIDSPQLLTQAAVGLIYVPEVLGNFAVTAYDTTIDVADDMFARALLNTTLDDWNTDRQDIAITQGTKETADMFKKWATGVIDTKFRAFNDYIVSSLDLNIPEYEQDNFYKIAYKTGFLSAPIIPLLRGFSLVYKTPAIYRHTSRLAQESLDSPIVRTAKNVGLTAKELTYINTNLSLKNFNAALGGGAAWQGAEAMFKDTEYESIAPLTAIIGAFSGATGPARLAVGTLTIPLRIFNSFYRMTTRQTEAPPNLLLSKLGALSAGANPVSVMRAKTIDSLAKVVGKTRSTGGFDESMMASIYKAIKQLPDDVQKEFYDNMATAKEMLEQSAKEGAEVPIMFSLAAITGLGVMNAIQKATMESVRMGAMTTSGNTIAILSSLEKTQIINQNNIKQIKKQFESIKNELNPNDITATTQSILKNVDNLLADVTENANTLENVLLGITDNAKTLLTHNEKIQINNVADVTFNNKRFQPKNTKEKENFKLDQITQATNVFRNQIENLLKNTWDSTKKQNDDLYKAAFAGKENEVVTLPASFIRNIDEQTDDMFPDKIASLFGKTEGATKLQQFKIITKRNHLSTLTEEQLAKTFNSLNKIHNSADDATFFTIPKNAMDLRRPADFKGVQATIKKLDLSEERIAKYVDFLSRIDSPKINDGFSKQTFEMLMGGPDKAFGIFNQTLFPAKVQLKDLLEFRKHIQTVSAKKLKSGDSLTKQQGEKLKRVANDLTDTLNNIPNVDKDMLKKYDTAKRFFRNKTLIWRDPVPSSLRDEVTFSDLAFGETKDVIDYFSEFLKYPDANKMTVAFEKLFNVPIRSLETGNIIKSQEENFQEAKILFQTTIGRVLTGQAKEGISADAFINNLSLDKIGIFKKAGLINDEQAKGLIKIFKKRHDINEKITSDVTMSRINRIQRSVIPELKTLSKEGRVPEGFAKIIEGITSTEGLLNALLFENSVLARTVSKEQVKSLREQITDVTANVQLRGKTTDVMDEEIEALLKKEGLGDDLTSQQTRQSFSDLVLKAVETNNKLTSSQKLQAFDDISRLLYHHIYSTSINITAQRNFGQQTNNVIREAAKRKAELDPNLHWKAVDDAGLQNEINIISMAKAIESINPLLTKIANKKRALPGLNEKQAIKESEKDIVRLAKLQLIYKASRIAVAKSAKVLLTNLPGSMGIASFISRAYAVVRGVVSLRFVASEAFVRAAHTKKIEMLTEALQSPEAVNTMEKVIVRGELPTAAKALSFFNIIARSVGGYVTEKLSARDAQHLLISLNPNPEDQEELKKELFKDAKKIPGRVNPATKHLGMFNQPNLK